MARTVASIVLKEERRKLDYWLVIDALAASIFMVLETVARTLAVVGTLKLLGIL
jgi:hypothetical protein